ncbi:DUF2442 domain-containing protein [Kaistia granuli]|uniref:DUF2442 domain-containing protein n=1 Tax=Kaistia granuli TaxID=363259 RepID=UPI00037F9D09|nr:DUF2442 domain-containing protein [Kaistia granuli]
MKIDPVAIDAAVTKDVLLVSLADGRELATPIDWFPRLVGATRAERENWQITGRGEALHWPDLGEDIAVASLLRIS